MEVFGVREESLWDFEGLFRADFELFGFVDRAAEHAAASDERDDADLFDGLSAALDALVERRPRARGFGFMNNVLEAAASFSVDAEAESNI